MRPLPIERLSRAPHFVKGMAIIRGTPLPVVHLGSLFGEDAGEPQRLVTVAIGRRFIALAVDRIIGIRPIHGEVSADLPPLLREADGDMVSAIGTLDSEFLFFLQTALILPQNLLADIDPKGQLQ
jgi:purine-binding chemotaxis protein CheW